MDSPPINRVEAGPIKSTGKDSIMPETEVVDQTDVQTDVQADGQTEDQQTDVQTDQTDAQVDGQQQDQTVPKSRLDEVIAENQALKEQANLAIQNAKIAQANKPPVQEQKPFDIYAHVGLDPEDPEDVPNQGQLKQINEYHANQNKQASVETQFLARHPDFDTIVGTDNGIATGKYAPPLQKAIDANPALARVILNTPPEHRREAAYQIAKSHFTKAPPSIIENTSNDAAAAAIKEAADTAARVKSAGNAAGGGVLSEEGRIATMSDKDFLQLMSNNGADLS